MTDLTDLTATDLEEALSKYQQEATYQLPYPFHPESTLTFAKHFCPNVNDDILVRHCPPPLSSDMSYEEWDDVAHPRLDALRKEVGDTAIAPLYLAFAKASNNFYYALANDIDVPTTYYVFSSNH